MAADAKDEDGTETDEDDAEAVEDGAGTGLSAAACGLGFAIGAAAEASWLVLLTAGNNGGEELERKEAATEASDSAADIDSALRFLPTASEFAAMPAASADDELFC